MEELAKTEKDLIINWRAFELRPEPVELLDPNGEYLTSAWRDHVYPLAEKIGVPMKKPPIQPRSRLAHEAAKWAGTHNKLSEYNSALFRAFFEFGLDIGDKQILKSIADDLTLDSISLGQALDSGQFTNDVIFDEEESQKLGIRAVPSFVSSNQLLASGVQSADRLRELLKKGPALPIF